MEPQRLPSPSHRCLSHLAGMHTMPHLMGNDDSHSSSKFYCF